MMKERDLSVSLAIASDSAKGKRVIAEKENIEDEVQATWLTRLEVNLSL